jgi:hypothetical protein
LKLRGRLRLGHLRLRLGHLRLRLGHLRMVRNSWPCL